MFLPKVDAPTIFWKIVLAWYVPGPGPSRLVIEPLPLGTILKVNLCKLYEKAIVEKALDKGVYYPGPGTNLAEVIEASDCVAFNPMGYFGPSTAF